MDEIKTYVDGESLSKNYPRFKVKYDIGDDTLYMSLANPPPAVSVDCKGLFWIRVNPENGEIVGIEIEGYRKVFLKRCKELMCSPIRQPIMKPREEVLYKELVGCAYA